MADEPKPLPQTFEVPLDVILPFAHADLPADFEGLFFRKQERYGLMMQEWEDMQKYDPRYYLPADFGRPGAFEKEGEIGVPDVHYLLIYQHGLRQDIVGIYGCDRTQYIFEGTDEAGRPVKAENKGWRLSIIADPNDLSYAKYGFINAGALTIFKMFYAHGMRKVTAEVDKTNYRSNAFCRWLGFKNPCYITKAVVTDSQNKEKTVPMHHIVYRANLISLIRHITHMQKEYEKKYMETHGERRSFTHADRVSPIDWTGQEYFKRIAQQAVDRMTDYLKNAR